MNVLLFLLQCGIIRHVAPRVIIIDRSRLFVDDVLGNLLRLCLCRFRHSQTNGFSQRTNRTLTVKPAYIETRIYRIIAYIKPLHNPCKIYMH